MGGSNEFYDKFSVRYHISVILKQLWEHPAHRLHIIAESTNTRDDAGFIRFVNMLINDTTFLLDESLDALKAIHDTQEAMKDTDTWQSQPQVSRIITCLILNPHKPISAERNLLLQLVEASSKLALVAMPARVV